MTNTSAGSAFLLKIRNEDGCYSAVAGVRVTRMLIEAGQVEIEAGGIFLGSAGEMRIRGNALGATIADYELSFEGGEKMRGRFLVQRLEYSGDFNGERSYNIVLKSVSEVSHG